MEWVETTGRTIEEAKELALDQLGVDGGDAEFEVVEEPKTGLFGRTRGSARVRARVLPKAPRAKTERRRRPKKSESKGSESADSDKQRASDQGDAKAGRAKSDDATPEGAPASVPRGTSNGDTTGGRRGGGEQREGGRDRSKSAKPREAMDMDEQVEVLRGFAEQLATAFGLDATAEVTSDEEELRVDLVGNDLGILVGPRLATLDAIQEVARNALQRQAEGREYARVVVDVQGIRRRRREALGEFVAEAAEKVREDDVTVVFEVMSSADRKVVHDVTTELDGVVSASEGEDPRRRVVLRRD